MSKNTIDLIMSAVNADIRRKADDRGQMGVGELAAELKAAGRTKPVLTSLHGDLGASLDISSYRGYYDQLAIEPGEPATAGELAAVLTAAIGVEFHGYKGGDYTMSRNTPVWVSGYGDCTGWAVTGVRETDDAVFLEITVEEW